MQQFGLLPSSTTLAIRWPRPRQWCCLALLRGLCTSKKPFADGDVHRPSLRRCLTALMAVLSDGGVLYHREAQRL